MKLPVATDMLLRQSAGLLAELASHHGIKSVQLGSDTAELVVEVEEGHTYFDLARFEAEVEALLHHRVFITAAEAPGAHPRELLATVPAA